MSNTIYTISFAALLHDIGKIGQRAFAANDGLSQQSKGMTQMLCPTRAGGTATHLHVLYTNEFFNLIEHSIPPCFDVPRVISYSVSHHRPSDSISKLIAEADRLASGMERVQYGADESEDSGTFRTRRLQPVCREVRKSQADRKSDSSLGHDLQNWKYDSTVLFPIDGSTANLQQAYRKLWDSLVERWQAIKINEPWQYLARAQSILEELTWCVPSATNVFPDISLFDHTRAVAAIAGCMHRSDRAEHPFLLVTGEFGGIQKYIFSIPHGSGQLAKALRGRSFLVRLFVEAVAFHILQEAGVPPVHRILTAGGRLYLLLPNDAQSRSAIDQASRSIDQWSLTETRGNLRFSIASVEMTTQDIMHFSDALDRLHHALREVETCPLQSALCNSDGWDTAEFLRPPFAPDADEYTYERTIGTLLPKSTGVALTDIPSSKSPFAGFEFLDSERSVSNQPLVLSWGPTKNDGMVPEVRVRLARHIPRDRRTGEILTFEEIAAQACGRHALGFVRADVDDLGYLFSSGLRREEKDRTSLSRIATLSRMLEGFFAGYVDNLIEGEYPSLYVVYSGGDDLFVVGPWDQTFQFAIRLRNELERFVGGSKAWGLSAGICVGTASTPVLDAAESAGRELEKSKAAPGKDALTLFDMTLKWSDAQSALTRGRQMLQWLQERVLSVAQVRRLLTYSRMFEAYRRTGDTGNLRYVYLLAYDLRRNWREDTDAHQLAKRWAQQLGDPSYADLPALQLACQYALYGARSS